MVEPKEEFWSEVVLDWPAAHENSGAKGARRKNIHRVDLASLELGQPFDIKMRSKPALLANNQTDRCQCHDFGMPASCSACPMPLKPTEYLPEA